jgi:hypothetical protein
MIDFLDHVTFTEPRFSARRRRIYLGNYRAVNISWDINLFLGLAIQVLDFDPMQRVVLS